MYETSCQSRFDAQYWILGAGALGRPRGMVWGGRREEGSGWGRQGTLEKYLKFSWDLFLCPLVNSRWHVGRVSLHRA